jgi:hypothetical protein
MPGIFVSPFFFTNLGDRQAFPAAFLVPKKNPREKKRLSLPHKWEPPNRGIVLIIRQKHHTQQFGTIFSEAIEANFVESRHPSSCLRYCMQGEPKVVGTSIFVA